MHLLWVFWFCILHGFIPALVISDKKLSSGLFVFAFLLLCHWPNNKVVKNCLCN